MGLLELSEVTHRYAESAFALGPVTLRVDAGEVVALVGPNGAGKSTLLRLMAGLIRPAGGSVRLGGETIATLGGRRRAQLLALLPQQLPGELDFTVEQVVLLGRFPYRSIGLFESPNDLAAARRAMELTGVEHLADRQLHALSGGEARRVHLAAAIAQEPKLLLLDEPTSSLDLAHGIVMFRTVSELARSSRTAVVMATHEVNLAARYCSRVIIVLEGKIEADGAAHAVLTPERLEAVFGVRMVALRDDAAGTGAWYVPSTSADGSRRGNR